MQLQIARIIASIITQEWLAPLHQLLLGGAGEWNGLAIYRFAKAAGVYSPSLTNIFQFVCSIEIEIAVFNLFWGGSNRAHRSTGTHAIRPKYEWQNVTTCYSTGNQRTVVSIRLPGRVLLILLFQGWAHRAEGPRSNFLYILLFLSLLSLSLSLIWCNKKWMCRTFESGIHLLFRVRCCPSIAITWFDSRLLKFLFWQSIEWHGKIHHRAGDIALDHGPDNSFKKWNGTAVIPDVQPIELSIF